MFKKSLIGAFSALAIGVTAAQAETEIVVQYPYGDLFNETHQRIAEEFAELRPDIKVSFRAPYESYEEGTQKVLRESITRQMPDVTFQGLNRIRILVDREIAVPLDDFIAAEKDFEAEGFHQAMYDIGAQQGKVYSLPFAISLPIAYYNLDLVEQAGGDPENLPTTWDEVFELAGKIDALGDDKYGMFYAWAITGNWFWLAPVFSQGGSMMDAKESKVVFDGAEGQWAIEKMAKMVNQTNMPDLTYNDGRSSFAAGNIGIWFTSTSDLARVTGMIDNKFPLKTYFFPDVKPAVGKLPAGGNGAIILSQDPEKQQAAWEFVKFATGPRGAAIVAETTGYMPPNKKANEVYLKDFYEQNPNNAIAVKQLPMLTNWYAWPGENGLKITDVIKDHMQSVFSRERSDEPAAVLKDMTEDVSELLPAGS